MPPAKTARNAEIMRLWAIGHSQASIAEKVGIAQGTVSQIIVRERAKLGQTQRDQLIQREIQFLEDLRVQAMEIADKTPRPMVAGKDGELVVDPATGEFVRDHAERLAAMREARGVSQDMRKLCGLDQPVKTEVEATVTRYVIEGVDPDDL